MKEKTPEFGGMGCPIWWHHHGSKMSVVAQGLCNDLLLLQGSAAELLIQRHQTSWLLTWKVIQGPKTAVSGTVIFPKEELLAAFGQSYDTPRHSTWLIDRYGGSAAYQGLFFRFQSWLNIPSPGTGHDGDPNISIKLDEKMTMTKAIMDLVYHNR
ncbi:hypothetical protein KJ866_00180 [Patescibacteria group bacterium]|nr:hypothetical protein [Patescibacteria group bacterium]MBU2219942.1 hypothetical protein [Patescibacteria group bacterium]MBU2264689.1 hypothetical protein [Patescibacteria group bacterium]